MSSVPVRVLVVERDEPVRSAITNAMLTEGYEVRALDDALLLDRVIGTFRPNLAVVEAQLSHGSEGLAVGRRLLAMGLSVIFVSATDDVGERLAGFALGADDFVTVSSPFVMAELVARVHAVARRSGLAAASGLQVGPIRIDLGGHTAWVDGAPLALTKTEFALLAEFCRHPGKVLSKSQLMNEIWVYDGFNPNVVEVHMSALRRKIEAHAARLIQTVHGVGYILRASAPPDKATAAS